MANEVFLISDTHFSHVGMTKFLNYDGSKVRPFDTVEEMDETMIENWNKTVKPTDKVYHLGDVVINRKALQILPRLNGRKVLIKGNHDIFALKEYTPHFYDIRAYHVLDNILMSHIPVHQDSKGRFKGNVHGHLHGNVLEDPWYFSVCVEQINYTPINLNDVIKYYEGR